MGKRPLLRIDVAAREAWYGGELVRLSYTGFSVLAYLASPPGVVRSKADIYRAAWQTDWTPAAGETVQEHIRVIRRALDDRQRAIIRTVYGAGYRLEPAALEEPPESPAVRSMVELLHATAASLQGHIEARAREIAAPLIEEARRAADERAAAAERALANERQRREDLAAEFRRQVAALERQVRQRRGAADA
ncbi:winged helix-turn-helix domain-containing protein [Microbispora sp. NPDC088329]|uniref:winged helix-turn-helix domain-containing protein n=1 Tax=Microbispora sp. NPDC088329 TaxID=3154869 RepID=UPI00341AF00F